MQDEQLQVTTVGPIENGSEQQPLTPFHELIDKINVLAEHPPTLNGNGKKIEDIYMGAFYRTSADILGYKNNSEDRNDATKQLARDRYARLLEVLVNDRQQSAEYASNLMFRCFQFMEGTVLEPERQEYAQKTGEHVPRYPADYDNQTTNWQRDIMKILTDPTKYDIQNGVLRGNGTLFEHLAKLFVERDTNTTQYQRYMSIATVLYELFPGQEISVIDAGCGANLGFPGIKGHKPFAEIKKDETGEHDLTQFSDHYNRYITYLDALKTSQESNGAIPPPDVVVPPPLQFSKIHAWDRLDPRKRPAQEWTFWCQYAREIDEKYHGNIEGWLKEQEDAYAAWNHTVEFTNHDITQELSGAEQAIVGDQNDAIIFSTVFYQLPEVEQQLALDQAAKTLRTGGVIIVQDFATLLDTGTRQTIEQAEGHPSTPFQTRGISWTDTKAQPYRTFVAVKQPDGISNFLEVFRMSSGRCTEFFPGKDYATYRDLIAAQPHPSDPEN